MTKNSKIFLSFVVGLVFVTTLAAQQVDIFFLIKKNFSIFSKSYETIALEYVDEVDPEKLMRVGLDAMLETLDPYTVIFDESQMEQAEILSTGNYAGVGIDVGFRNGEAVIIAPFPDGPADRKGIRPGDIIVAVDGVSTENLQPDQIQELTSGEIGSKVNLSIKRPLVDSYLEFELSRERIEISNVFFSGVIDEENKIGYIKLAQFGENSAEEVRLALVNLVEEHSINGLILDLRDNPGGILQESVSILDKFIEPGVTVVETRGRVAEFNDLYATREPVYFEKPVTVLINEGSASASEIVAGALQDLDRAVILGEQSFGKGLVQIVKPLPYNIRMKITISKYYIPSGRSIQSIDYQGNRDGNSEKNQTSLKEFKTKNGRVVFEGRGIQPDKTSENLNNSLLQTALLQNGIYFDFATQYYAKNSDKSFDRLPTNLFEEFKSYLNNRNFSYKTDAEDLLLQLKDKEILSSGTEAINSLQKIIDSEKEKTLDGEKEIIEKSLYLEILSRYKSQPEVVKEEVMMDELVLESVRLMRSPSEINRILKAN